MVGWRLAVTDRRQSKNERTFSDTYCRKVIRGGFRFLRVWCFSSAMLGGQDRPDPLLLL
jgi:hypothetical protein